MDFANKFALLSCLLLSIINGYVDAEGCCSEIAGESRLWQGQVCSASVNITCKNDTGDIMIIPEIIVCNVSDSGTGGGIGSGSDGGLNSTCMEIESSFNISSYNCSCISLTCPPVSNFNCNAIVTTISPTSTITITESLSRTTTESTPTTVLKSTPITESIPTKVSTSITSELTVRGSSSTSFGSPTRALSTASENTIAVSTTTESDTIELATNMITLVLWIVLGCLIALIIITLCAIFLVSFAHCRRYKRKKQPTALDIISKWEDTPNESSDIQLLSMKAIEDNEDKSGEEKNDGRAEEKEGDKEGSNGKLDKVEIKELSKEDDITIGTFGFAEKAVESTTSKAENPTTVIELEDQSKKEGSAKEDKNDTEKLIEVTIEKAGQESANGTSSAENPAPSDNKGIKGTDTTIPAEKEKAQEGTKSESVPVQIPVIGKQVADEKAPGIEHAADSEVKTPEQSDKPASHSKDQVVKPEASPSSQDVPATESVSKEPEPAAAITKPQTEDVKTVSLASDKPPSAATGGLSLFTNEDMEKALGVAATKDLESTQL